MIRLACTNCRNILTIDDAFAGGVCRCQHCGTIQTVPATTAADEVVVGGPNLGGGRNGTAFGTPHSGTGLDELAGAVVSSGLSSRRLTRPDGRRVAGAPHARRQNLMPLVVAAGVIIAMLLGIVIYQWKSSSSPVAPRATEHPIGQAVPGTEAGTGGTPGAAAPVTPAAPAAPATPVFCGTPLTGDTVIYLIDRGTASQEVLPMLKDATLKSITSLGADRHFQIVFWDNGSNDGAAYPSTGTTYATPSNVDAARRSMTDITAFGATDIKPALTQALAQHPDVIVIATAKGWTLDDAWVKDVLATRGAAPVRIDTFSLGATPAPEGSATPPLKTVADQTGGTYTEVANADLKSASE